jgi:hypothetical protein
VPLPADWSPLVADHAAALSEYDAAARKIPAPAWMQPIGPGKWTPAEVTSHVAEAYRVLRGELAGGSGMRLLGTRLRRFILRHTVLPRLLAGRPFPPGVPAPRETRPQTVVPDREQAISQLDRLAELFVSDLGATEAGSVRLSHAYFGALSARQALQLLAVHTRHHASQLSTLSRPPDQWIG